jgi:hypothetical protein
MGVDKETTTAPEKSKETTQKMKLENKVAFRIIGGIEVKGGITLRVQKRDLILRRITDPEKS